MTRQAVTQSAMLQDVLYLFQFISYSGASTLIIPAGSDSVETAPSSKGIRALRVMQKATCLAIFLLLLGVSVFEIWKFAIVFSKMDNIAEIINNAIWLTPFPLAALSQLFYAINRSALFDFFNHWEETCLEYNASTDDAASSHKVVEKQLCPRLFYIYLLTICISVAMVMFAIFDFPILVFLPQIYSTDEPFGNKNTAIIIICALFVVPLFYAWTLSATSDLVPSLIYFHLAVALENIVSKFFILKTRPPQTRESNHQSNVVAVEEYEILTTQVDDNNDDIPDDWHKGWLYYEAIRKLVDKTNSLFGFILLVNHGAMFFVASANIFSILRFSRGMSPVLLLVNGVNAAAIILRFSTSILICCRLSTASERLESKISSCMAANWSHLNPSERQFLTAFLVRVSQSVVASPLNLYPIRPFMLLGKLSLLFTYLIVMLQSTGPTAMVNYGNFTGLITGTRFYYND